MRRSKKIFYRADTNEIKDGVYVYTQNEPPTLSVRNMGMEQSTEQRKPRFIANHMTFCLHYILSGQGFLKTKKKAFCLKAGDFFYLIPHEEMEYGHDPADPWNYAWINFTGENLLPFLAQINVTPVPKITFIVGKLIPYWIIGIIVLSVGMLVAWLLYGLRPEGSVLLLYGLSLVFVFGISGLGLIISNYSSNMQQAMFMIFFIIIVFILMSGIFTPVSSMPEWARVISMFDPFTYFAQIMSMIYLKGSTFRDILQYVYPLLAFFVVIIGWAVLSYRKRG